MDCKGLKENIIDYMSGTLNIELTSAVEEHLKVCRACRDIARDFEKTESLVRSLEKVPVPAGFDKRLRRRLAACQRDSAHRRLLDGFQQSLKEIFSMVRMRSLLLRPTVVGVLLCLLVSGSIFLFFGGSNRVEATDRAFIEVCQEQHVSFAAGNPLADESAVILKDRVLEIYDQL